MKPLLTIVFFTLPLAACCQQGNKPGRMNDQQQVTKTKEISCKLTSPEMQQRKATIIASLRTQVLQKKELPNGFSYRFKGTDAVIDELIAFIKSERLCCDFFDFNLAVGGDAATAWLTITGGQGVKEFITVEIGL